jgi:hypothetical protein
VRKTAASKTAADEWFARVRLHVNATGLQLENPNGVGAKDVPRLISALALAKIASDILAGRTAPIFTDADLALLDDD